MKPLADFRKNYERGELDEEHASKDPRLQFDQWMAQAIELEVPEPTAMTLATVGEGGRPSTRIVLLKGNDERGLVWYTNYRSRKGRELAQNARAALQFHWVELERVVRIEGSVTMVEDADSDAYYASRPLASRIGAWASEQSQPLPSRASLVAKAAEYGLRYALNPPRPPHWGGYRLTPDYWEFWQGRRSRLHDRLAYTLVEGAWARTRLSP
ncbi:MAG: pyridoxamine 5'-phosphate oxidase [Burkholderiaceae bacterium]|nr:pyridoxamine 5'-phosphate oxidase [Burkholderiaceae bacterium]